MSPAFIVTLSIWFAVSAWAVVWLGRLLRGREIPGARVMWFAGLTAYLVHVLAAFATHYHWSHAVALAETARQTREATGVDSGVGLWLNYGFGLLWLIDALRWLATGEALPSARGWARAATLAIHGFLAFMVLNGTVIFGQGAVRGYGIAVFASLAAAVLRAKLTAAKQKTPFSREAQPPSRRNPSATPAPPTSPSDDPRSDALPHRTARTRRWRR